MWKRIKLVAEWIFDQLIYPWVAGSIHAADVRHGYRREYSKEK